MGTIKIITPRRFIGLDADKSTVIGLSGDVYEATDTGIEYFWNTNLSLWDNGHKVRIRRLGRGVTTIGTVTPGPGWTNFSKNLSRGTDKEGLMTNILFYLSTTPPANLINCRLQDVTNALTIGQLNNIGGADASYDLGVLSNQPIGQACTEFQTQPVGGATTVTMDCINAFFD